MGGSHALPCGLLNGYRQIQQIASPSLARGHPMLNRHRSSPSPLATFLFLPISVLACDVVSGRPSTSAPRDQDVQAYGRARDEKEEALHDWERGHERRAEDEWTDGRRGILQLGAKIERI